MGLQRRIRPAATELGLAFAGLVVGWLVASVVLSGVRQVLPEGAARTSVGLLLGPLITGAAAFVYLQLTQRWPRDDAPAPPPPRPEPLSRTALYSLAGMLAALGGSMMIGLLVQLLGVEVEEQAAVLAIVDDARSGGAIGPAIVLCLSASLLAPVAEEWLFRGLLFRRIHAASGPVLAYAVSGLAFAAIHNNLPGFAVYLWLGIVFAATLQWTGRLSAAIFVHFANNAFVLATLFLGIE